MSSTSSSSGGAPSSGGGGTAGTSAERAGEFGGLRRSNRIRKPVAGATTNTAKENAAASWSDGSGALAAGADDGDTGAPWTEAEVTQFYHGLRQHGRAWKKIASELKNRTPEMVAALYEQNGGYLSLPPEHTSALALYKIIADRQRPRPAGSVASVGEQGPPSPPATRKSQRSATEPRRDRKRKLFDSPPPPADRSRRRSAITFSGRKELNDDRDMEAEEEEEEGYADEEEESVAGPRKGRGSTTTARSSTRRAPLEAPSSYAASSSGSGAQMTDALPPKLRAKWASSKHHLQPPPASRSTPTREAKRKRASDTRAESNDKAKAKIQTTLTNFMKSERTAKWSMYEWFCADMDRPFFEYNDFQHCLNEMGLGHITHLTRVEWGHVRSVMGKPRRFSQAFLQGERAKLHDYRANIRELRNGKSPISRSFYPPVSEIPLPMPIGVHALAFHPSQRRLSRGVVIAVGDGQYQVDFIDKQMNANLGGIWVADTDLMTHEPRSSFAADYPGQESPRTPTRAGSVTHVQYPQEDLQSMVGLLRLLLQKEQCIAQLREMNNKAESAVGRADECGEEFQKQYAHIVVSLAETNQLVEPALRRVHARSPLHSPEADRNVRWVFPSPTDSPSSSPVKPGNGHETAAAAPAGVTDTSASEPTSVSAPPPSTQPSASSSSTAAPAPPASEP
ncbi:Myblike DNA-binding domain containing protein [Acanthamoeba castellanii str. Neff]|uniref:Myblike DNA-binding domain containing protein n=1 Tax=Acanthamoeba castellanii (strain ATCC 30010 / Neff) TaxID=1257118 RepID=L8HJY9_ACACF|nr:Myblike DNA-binding domain containing protein [Acanthamoeba castellanii str. Neff]ELR24993.1 Myblike DNA-binding domain containing protein [Acanthamoeba castellanii str. Neff]